MSLGSCMATLVLMLMPGEGRGEGEKCLNQWLVGWLVDRFALENTLYLCSIEIWTWPTHCFCPTTLGKLPPTYWHGLWRANHTNLLERLRLVLLPFEQLLQTGATTKCITVVNNNSRALLLGGAKSVAQKNQSRLPC